MIENTIQELKKSIDQLTVVIEALLETQRAAQARPAVADKPAAAGWTLRLVKAPKAEESAPAAEEPAPAPAPEPTPVPAAPVAPVAPPAAESYTVQDLRAEAQKALESGKSAKIVELNKEYGVKRISEVPPELFAVIIAKLRAINGQA